MSTDNSQKPQTQAQVYRERQMESLRRTLGDDILGFLNDPAIIEIMLNQDGRIWVDVLGGDMEPRSAMDPVRAKMVIETVASMLDTSITKENPIISGELPLDGSRFEAQIPPIVEAPTFAIRKKALLVFTLDDYVAKGIMTERQRDIIIDAVRERKNILVSGGTGCFEKGHPILMLDGSIKPVEQIVVGDQVMGPDGHERRVKDVHGGIDHMVRIVPHRGEPFIVNQWHELALIETHKATRHAQKCSVVEWIRKNAKFKHNHKLYYAPALDTWRAQYLPIDPYFMGVLLGDGSFMDSVSVSKPDAEILCAVNDAASAFGLHVNTYARSENNPTHKLFAHRGQENRLIGALRTLGLFKKSGMDKFIPSVYKTASLEQRLELLAGLLDTDGHLAAAAASSFDFISVSEQLADDLAFVARSCGLYARVTPCEKSCPSSDGNTFTGNYFRVYVGGNVGIIPTRIPRKQSEYGERDYLVSGIKECQSLGPGAYYGFEVDHPDHLFVDGYFMVQGNSGKTTMANAILHTISEKTPDHRIMIIQDTLELQCAAPNAVFFRTSDEIDMTRLLKSTMRMRPDRIIVGEVRGKEALDLLKAWSTGHPGGIGTVHANDARAALVRIGMLVQEANVPPNPELIAEAVNIVISIKRTATGRIVDEVLAVKGFENGRFLTESL